MLLVITGLAGETVKVSVAVPVPFALVALMMTEVVPLAVGVPVMPRCPYSRRVHRASRSRCNPSGYCSR